MESLDAIELSLNSEWDGQGTLQILDLLIQNLSQPGVSKKEVSKVWRISNTLSKKLPQSEKSALLESFTKASGNFHLQLRLYSRLKIPNNLKVLARLTQSYFKFNYPKKIPFFKCDYDPAAIKSPFFPAVLFLTQPEAREEVVKYFQDKFLSGNASKEDRTLLPLFKPTLQKWPESLFIDSVHSYLKRICLRTSLGLTLAKEVYSLVSCDFSSIISDFTFPTLIEYLNKEQDFQSALDLLKLLISKCRNLQEFVNQLCAIRNVNEGQLVNLLHVIKCIPTNAEQLIDYIVVMSQRIKTEANKGLVAQSIRHLVRQENAPKDFLLSNLSSPYFANIVFEHDLKVNLNFNQSTPMSLISVLSLKVPDQIPAKIVNFFNETTSVLFTIQNISEDEAFALTRAVVNGLKVYPNNVLLLKRLARSVVSKYKKVREFTLSQIPGQNVQKIFEFLTEFIQDESLLLNFSQVFYRFVKISVSLLKDAGEVDSFLTLLSQEAIFSKKRMKFTLKNISIIDLPYSKNVLESVNSASLALSLPNYYETLQEIIPSLDIDHVLSVQKTKEFVLQVYDDPNFDEIGKFNTLCREILTQAGLPTVNLDQPTVLRALDINWTSSLSKTRTTFYSLIKCLSIRSLNNSSSEFLKELAFKVLPSAMRLSNIDELQGTIWDFFYALVSHSSNLAPITWHFTVSLFKSSRNKWHEKSFSKVFKYTEDKLSIGQLRDSECFMLERIVLWVLRQVGTSLRAAALNVLVDYLRAQRFTDLKEVIQEICLLIENYSSPMLNSLFVPLIEIIDPEGWKAFMNILLNLEPNTKQVILDSLLQYSKDLPNEAWLISPIYLCLFDDTDLVSSSASEVWEKNKLSLSLAVLKHQVLGHLFSENLELSIITANAVSSALSKNTAWTEEILTEAQRLVLKMTQKAGFLKFLNCFCPVVANKQHILSLQEFLLDKCMGFDSVSSEFLNASILYLNTFGGIYLNEYFTIIQQRTTHENESIRNSAVVLAGHLAKFFSPDDFRIESTIELLLKSLEMPSDLLFSTVSKCLPRLVSYRVNLIESLINSEFKKILENKPIEERRGAGYGLACLVKGGGLKNIVSFNVLDRLESIINNKKAQDCEKAGVLIAIEGLGAVLGRSFEPYLGEVLPFIIDCFAVKELQEQAALSTKIMISKLSAHGMKRILPQLTLGLEETKWRSKVGAIEALGKMAFCAPKQLSAALPSIVPQVIKAFSDINPKVLEAANKAITDIGSVITNPEIFQLVPFLSKALGNISHLSEAFKVIIDTTFHHYLDAASLSLIVPLVETGLKSRNSEYKKQACQIFGGIASLVRSGNELSPYIERIMNSAKFSLFDSLPEVRNIAAQNLALFCEGIGEELSKSIIDWLKETMEKSQLNYERSGAVQALSEYYLYRNRWEKNLDDLLRMCKDPSAIIKESYLGLFIFIPLNTQGEFEQYLGVVMPAFLERLSDENEDVRKIAIRVVQLIIQTYCKNSLNIILPHLEAGLFDKNWRKRSSCITLIGEMIDKIEHFSRKESQQLISTEHKNRILASVYILRADHTSNINAQAAQIWKAHVDNTPKFLMTLTAELVLRLIEISDSNDPEPREIAAYSIQNLIQKYQNKIFSSYLKHFLSHFSKYPKGVAFALRTVCESATRNLLVNNTEPIITILEELLKSENVDYLNNAGGIFHDLYQKTNIDKPDPTVMALLDKMVNYPLACKELLGFKNSGITKSLLPKIISSAQKLVILPIVGNIIANDLFLVKGLESLFPNLLKDSLSNKEMLKSLEIILYSISDLSCLLNALNQVQELLPPPSQLFLINSFCKSTSLVYQNFVDKLLSMVLLNLSSAEPEITSLLPETVKLVLKPIEKEDQPDYFEIFKSQLNTLPTVPLFNIPKGLDPFLPFIQNSLMYGMPDVKELAARSYYDVIRMTENDILNNYAVMIVGPLIRVLSEKNPGDVKVSILDALHLLMQKTPLKLKPFVSQLQSTFTKAISHSESHVRDSASRNIIELLKMKPRLDLIFGDLGTLQGQPDVVSKSLATLSKIIKLTEVPSQLLSSTCNRIISELSGISSNEIAQKAGKLVYLINTDLAAVVQCLDPVEPSVVFLAAILKKCQPQALQVVSKWIEQGLRSNFEEVVRFFEFILDYHPEEGLEMVKKNLREFGRNIENALGIINKIPGEKWNEDLESLGKILPSLAKECLYNNEKAEALEKTVRHIFMIKDKKGIKNVLKVLHLLDEDLQNKFRAYVQSLE